MKDSWIIKNSPLRKEQKILEKFLESVNTASSFLPTLFVIQHCIDFICRNCWHKIIFFQEEYIKILFWSTIQNLIWVGRNTKEQVQSWTWSYSNESWCNVWCNVVLISSGRRSCVFKVCLIFPSFIVIRLITYEFEGNPQNNFVESSPFTNFC